MTETRIGRPLPQSFIEAQMALVSESQVVGSFTLGASVDQLNQEKEEMASIKRKINYEESILTFLRDMGGSASKEMTLKEVKGRRENLGQAIDTLEEVGRIKITGTAHSPTEPLTLTVCEVEASPQSEADKLIRFSAVRA